MITREAIAATLALAGIRTGAHVLDLAPHAGLTRAARAMAGTGGRVDQADQVDADDSAPPVRYGYALGIWSDRPASAVVDETRTALPKLAPDARVTVGSAGSLAALLDELRAGGWTVLHGTTVPDAEPVRGRGTQLAIAVARRPE